MDKIKNLLDTLKAFERVVHLPTGQDITVTGVMLAIACAVVLALLILIIVIGVMRKRGGSDMSDVDTVEMQQPYYPQDGPMYAPQPYGGMQQPYGGMLQPYTDPAQPSYDRVQPGYDPNAGIRSDPFPPVVDNGAQAQTVPVEQGEIEATVPFGMESESKSAPEPETEPETNPTITLIGSGGFFDRKQITQQNMIIFGRHPQRCTLVYPGNEPGISGVHCRVQKTGNDLFVTDLNSKCGTFVNGEKLQPNVPFRLQKGDTFWLADQKNSFFMV